MSGGMEASDGRNGGAGGPIRSVADERLASAILALHASTEGEAIWRSGCDLLRAAMPAFHYLMALPTAGMSPFMLRTTLPVPDEPDYWERLNRAAPLEKMITRFAGKKIARMSDVVPMALMRLTPFYRKFMRPEGWRYSAAMFFWDGDQFLGQFSQNRTAAQGDFTDDEMALLRALYPHFETAIRRVILLDGERAARRSMEEAIARSPLPTAMLDWDLTPIFHNRAAAEASAVWRLGPIAARATRAEFAVPPEIAATCREIGDDRQRAILDGTLLAGARDRLISHATLTGAQASVRLIEGDGAQFVRPRFLVQFSLLAGGPENGDAVQLLARLSPAEREVAVLAARGLGNNEIAAELAVSRSTVRTHLRHVFKKLGITSRNKLAPLYATLTRPNSV